MTGEHTQRVAAAKKIPWSTVVRKARKTVLGLGVATLGIAIAEWWIPPLNQWAVYACLFFGGYCVAGDIVRELRDWVPAFLKDLAVGIRDLVAAVKGKSS